MAHHHHHDARHHFQQGKAAFLAGDHDAAFRELGMAIHMVEDHDASNDFDDADMGELYLLRGTSQLLLNGERVFQDAELFFPILDDLEQAVISMPSNAEYRLARARFYKRCQFEPHLTEAREDLEAILEAFPRHVEALEEMGEVFLREDRYQEAIGVLSKAIDLGAGGNSYQQRGLAHFRSQPPNFLEATKDFYQAQLAEPENSSLYLWRAQAFQELGNFKEAIREYSLLLSFEPDQASYYVDRGFLYDQMGQAKAAFDDYNQAIDLTGHPLAYNNRAMHHLQAGRHQAAILDAEAALDADPNLGIAYATLAEIYADLEDLDNMLRYLAPALEKYYEDGVAVLLEPAFEPFHEDPGFQALISRP